MVASHHLTTLYLDTLPPLPLVVTRTQSIANVYIELLLTRAVVHKQDMTEYRNIYHHKEDITYHMITIIDLQLSRPKP